ncbi:MAG: sugar phosphate isomerase/epimerase [Clostridia bacterium]|nr:sugar phosphate isomerase/epimerase [Clostridia bacterium]
MIFPVSIQLFSLRDDLEKDARNTLISLKEMGYDGIEPYGGKDLYGFTQKEFIEFMNSIDLKVPSAHISFETLMADPDDTFSFHKSLGCKYLAMPYLNPAKWPGKEDHEGTYEQIQMLCEKGKEYDIQLCFHNHEGEFAKLDNKYIIEHILDGVPGLKAEYDTAWIAVMNVDPVEYIKENADKCALIHLKDYYRKKEITEGRGELRPIGYGVQNIPHLLDAAEEAGVEWIVVEQDLAAFGKSNLECAKMSIDYLRQIMK